MAIWSLLFRRKPTKKWRKKCTYNNREHKGTVKCVLYCFECWFFFLYSKTKLLKKCYTKLIFFSFVCLSTHFYLIYVKSIVSTLSQRIQMTVPLPIEHLKPMHPHQLQLLHRIQWTHTKMIASTQRLSICMKREKKMKKFTYFWYWII